MKYIFVPDNLNIEDLIKEFPIDVKPDRIYCFVYKYFQTYLFDKEARRENGFVYIFGYAWNELSSDYKKILNWLEEREIFSINRSYFRTMHPRKYRLNPIYLEYGLRTHEIRDKRTLKTLDKHGNKPDPTTIKNNMGLWASFNSHKLKFTDNIDKAIDDLYKADIEIHGKDTALIRRCTNQFNVLNIKHHQYWFYQDTTGFRLHTNITNLKKELRIELRYDNKRLKEIDIKNSQPYFSVHILLSKYIMIPENTEKPTNIDLQAYLNKVLDGTIYDFFEEKYIEKYGSNSIKQFVNRQYRIRMALKNDYIRKKAVYGVRGFRTKQTGISRYIPPNLRGKPTRVIVKTMFFSILYGSSTTINEHINLFKELFPTVWDLLVAIKSNPDTPNFAVELQKKESEAILNQIVKKLKARNRYMPLFTIHDCIVTTEQYIDELEEFTTTELNRFTEYTPSLKRESWN